jgi:hypothetical protein
MDATMSDNHEREKAELRKINEEGAKFIAEQHKLGAEQAKLFSETALNNKKTKWFEFTMILALIAATVTVTKIWL